MPGVSRWLDKGLVEEAFLSKLFEDATDETYLDTTGADLLRYPTRAKPGATSIFGGKSK